jgi:threonine synthase
VRKLTCIKCGVDYSLDEPVWQCTCGGVLEIQFTPSFSLDKIKERKPTLWRYREAIPINDDINIVSLDEGFTPLLPVEIGGQEILVKQEQLCPTGSFKDRGTTVLVSKIKELGMDKVIEDSSGNAGSSLAAYAARAGIQATIFAPAHASPGKLVQMQMYGAEVNKIPGPREATRDAALEAAKKTFYASHAWSPYYQQGTKTFGYEVCEQLGWEVPDTFILCVGGGSLFMGAYMGCKELKEAGIVDRIPKMVAVQAENCAPLYAAFKQKSDRIPKIEKQDTIAEGISIAEPVRGLQILKIVNETGGEVLAVSESEIVEALKETTNKGFYIEPTSAVAMAGVKKYLKNRMRKERIGSAFTGHGLKAMAKMLEGPILG